MLNSFNLGFSAAVVSTSALGYYFYNQYINKSDSNSTVTKTLPRECMDLLNLTPHDVNVYQDGEQIFTVPREGVNLRLEGGMAPYQSQRVNVLGGEYYMKVRDNTSYTGITDFDSVQERFPDMKKKDIIVSGLVADFLMKNSATYRGVCQNVLVPDTDPKSVVRDDKGRIIGVQGFIDYGNLSQ